jgi:LmbE family N-acetylglucosaminyl deacetylase
MTKGDIVVIAAHSDDTALCLGGFLQTVKSNKKIINVFSTCACSVDKNLTTFEAITKANNQEEELFAKSIDAGLVFLNFNEVLMRGYKRWTGKLLKSDKFLILKIARKIKNIIKNDDVLFFPMAIGDHVDHKILFSMAAHFRRINKNIYFYEDLPYATEITRRKLCGLTKRFTHPELIDITKFIDNKILFCGIYKTQYDLSYLEQLKDYAGRLGMENGDNKYYERIWQI